MDESVRSVPTRLRAAADLFEERNAAYGGNYLTMGAVMSAIYPQGLTVKTQEEWTRLMLQVLRVMKETRYAQNFQKGGHEDSLDDLAVYALMAAETDDLAREKGRVVVQNSHKHSDFEVNQETTLSPLRVWDPPPGTQRIHDGVREILRVSDRGHPEWVPSSTASADSLLPRSLTDSMANTGTIEPNTVVMPPHNQPHTQQPHTQQPHNQPHIRSHLQTMVTMEEYRKMMGPVGRVLGDGAA